MKISVICAAMVVAAAVAVHAQEGAAPAAPAIPGMPVATPEQIAAAIAAYEGVKLDGDAVKGEAVYKQYCALCHGDTGNGDGVGAAALDPKPRKFSDKALMDTISDAQIVTVIKEGGAAVGKSMFMVSWKALLTDEQVKDVGTYIRTLAK